MKKLIGLLVAALLLSQAAFAQICVFRIDGDKITYNSNEIDIHDISTILEKQQKDFEDVFVYVTYDTPLGFAEDVKAMIEGSCTSGVVFVNPERNGDFPRMYGPKMAYHAPFIETEMLKKGKIATFSNTNDNPWDFILEGAAPDDYAYNSTRMLNYIRTPDDKEGGATNWTNNFDGVLLNLSYQTPIGVLYSFNHYLNQESLPYINVVFHTIETPLCPERFFTVRDNGLEEYDIPTVPAGGSIVASYSGHDLKYFSDTYQAFESVKKITAPGARPGKGRAIVEFEITPLGTISNVNIVRTSNLPGLDEVIVNYLGTLPGLWAPQFDKGQPVNVKVSCPIYGELSQW